MSQFSMRGFFAARSLPLLIVATASAGLAIATAVSACSSSSSPPNEAPDAAADASTEAAGPAGYPAFTVDVPQIEKNQGAVLSAPVVVTVTWPAADTNSATWEAFGDGLGASDYWTATTAEYGVGAATSGSANHVRMTQALPATLSYTELQNFVVAQVQAIGADAGAPDSGVDDDGGVDEGGIEGGASGPPNPSWPAPTVDSKGNVQTIYSLFIPTTTSVTDPGSGASFCDEGGLGYHDNLTVNGKSIVYSVSLECQDIPGIEETAAHETVEAATNPYTAGANHGYVGFDAPHIAWDLYSGYNDELADACQNWQDSYVQDTGTFPYWIQRSWSNKSALAGHDPCAPISSGAYHGMTLIPSEETSVTVNLSTVGETTTKTQGFAVTVGQPTTFHVGFFSDAPTDAWTISYDFPSVLPLFDASFNELKNGKATVTIDKTSGQNGDLATVTVTPTTKGAAGFQVMAITWDAPTTKGYQPHYLPIVLVDQ